MAQSRFSWLFFTPLWTIVVPVSVMAAPSESVPVPSIAPLKLPPIQEETLPNGLSVVTVRKADLPLVAIRLVIRTGATLDPKGKEGLAAFTGGLLRRGTRKRSADEIDNAVESVGGLLGVDVGYEGTSIAATVPAEHVATALDVVADLARNASFPTKQFDLEKRRSLAQLKQDLDDPSTVADRALVRFFYGKDHPFGHPVEGNTKSVRRIERGDIASFYRKTYSPHGAVLFFVGDIDPAEAGRLARSTLADWEGHPWTPKEIQNPGAIEGPQILLVDKPDATQAQVRVTVPGISRNDPSYFGAVVANTVLGGGFTSRLVDEVRVNQGLSYSVSTRVVALRRGGAISYSTFTQTDTVRKILDVSFKVLSEFHDRGPTEEEVVKAKRYVIGLYPGRVESIDQLAEALAAARLNDLPFRSIEEYRGRIGAIDRAGAAAVAQLFPIPKVSKIVIVGNASKIEPQLRGFGTVTAARVKDFE